MIPGASELPVAGLTPFTTIDYPGHLAAVVFCQGCPWRCVYCHNPALRPFRDGALRWREVRHELERRRGWIEAVVFSGGEPTAHPELVSAMLEVRRMGYKVGLHTAGIYPGQLARALPQADWVGLDIKAPLGRKYDFITGAEGAAHLAFESLMLLLSSQKSYQLRTTLDSRHLTLEDVDDINAMLAQRGAPPVTVQAARPSEDFSRFNL